MSKRLVHISRIVFVIVLVFLLASCEWPPEAQVAKMAAGLGPPPAGAWVDAPLNGAEAPPGTPIQVIGHVDQSVGQAVLYINGANSGLAPAPILNKRPPAYEWVWIPGQPGVYDLRVGGAVGPLSSVVRVTISGEMPFSSQFWADQTTMKPGECTALHWTTENALMAYLDGTEVDLQGDLGVCPQQDETHVLQVQYQDNTSEELMVNLTVVVDIPTPTTTLTATPTATPTGTPTFTPTLTSYVPPMVPTTVTPYVPPVVPTTVTPYVPPVVTTTVPPPSDATPPPAPGGLSPCGSSISTPALVTFSPVDLSWSAVKDPSGIAQYKIDLMNNTTKQTSEYYTVTTTIQVTIQNGTYLWQVNAQDGAGNWGPPSQKCYFYYDVIK